MNFSGLYKKNVTSLQLLDWSAPIDVAERYERSGQNSSEIFYNCSYLWFGSTCQYRLIDNISSSFGEVVKFIIGKRGQAPLNLTFSIGTCYPFLNNCYRGPSPICLDWREICDGDFDCINEEDEELCSIMEINECSNDEFQCHYSAECIPWSFVRDATFIDCLDATDEMPSLIRYTYSKYYCYERPTFECEESAQLRSQYFSCGDGQFVEHSPPKFLTDSLNDCANLRNRQMTLTMFTSLDYISKLTCQQALSCLLGINQMDVISSIINKDSCESLNDHCNATWVIFPEYPIIYRLFQFIYFTNRTIQEFKINVLPDLICFNQSICPGLLFCSIDIEIHNGLKCCQAVHLIGFKLDRFTYLHIYFHDTVQRCLLIGKDKNCSKSSLFHCRNSSKCISKHRVLDGHKDCYFGEDEQLSACELNDNKRFICKTDPNKCYSIVAIDPQKPFCLNSEYENPINKSSIWKKPLLFGWMCDSYIDIQRHNSSDDTDETNCSWWPCNNPYTRCDGVWHCLNGLDELNCSRYYSCSANEHGCTISESNKKFCFPITHLMEDYTKFNIKNGVHEVYLTNTSIENITNYLFYNQTKCITVEHLSQGHLVPSLTDEDVCLLPNWEIHWIYGTKYIMKIGQLSCNFISSYEGEMGRPFFLTSQLGYFPLVLPTKISIRTTYPLSQSKNFDLRKDMKKYWYCNRGIRILFKINNSYIQYNLCM